MTKAGLPAHERVMMKVVVTPSGCWEFRGAHHEKGYGSLNVGGGVWKSAHCIMYEHLVGPVPEGKELDHLCRNEPCCNPKHLEAVTHKVNMERSSNANMQAHLAGTCKNGHPASESYRRKSTGNVVYCRTCRKERNANATSDSLDLVGS